MNKLIEELKTRLVDKESAKVVEDKFHFNTQALKALLHNMVEDDVKEFDSNKELFLEELSMQDL